MKKCPQRLRSRGVAPPRGVADERPARGGENGGMIGAGGHGLYGFYHKRHRALQRIMAD